MADNEKTDKEIAEVLLNQLDDTLKSICDLLNNFPESEKMEIITNIFPTSEIWIKDTIADCNDPFSAAYLLVIFNTLSEYTDKLKEYLNTVEFKGTLQDFIYKPTKEKRTFFKIWLDSIDPEIKAALNTLEFALTVEKRQLPGNKYRSSGGHRVKKIDWTLDKVNNTIWDLLRENTHGQLELPIKAEGHNKKKPIDIMYSIDFDDIESDFPIVKRLTQFDKRVYISVGALYNAGNNVMSIAQIYSAMGFTGTPNEDTKEKIYKSLVKMNARITLNNRQEIEAGYNYPQFEYEGALLPYEIITEKNIINGKLIEAAIHVFREPPLISFAKGRRQVTTIPIKMLQSKISKTENNLALEDYLIERISRAKNAKKKTEKILWDTIYKKVYPVEKMKSKETEEKRKRRLKDTVKRYLDYYIECANISGIYEYTTDKTGITIKLK